MPKKKEDSSEEGRVSRNSVKGGSVNNMSSFKPFYIVIIFLILVILTFFATYIALSEERFEEIPTCGDGTFYDTCSIDRPYYCGEGILTEKASLCGCNGIEPSSEFRKEGDFCVSEHNDGSRVIPLTYFLDGNRHEFNFTIFEGVNNHVSDIQRSISYSESEIPFRADFKRNSVSDEIQRENILPLVKSIQNLAPENKADQARIAISIVQNIPYGFSNETIDFEGTEVDYSRYPYEVLFDNQGICGEKSSLMALLLKDLGFGVSIFYFSDENHEAVGIKCPVEESLHGTGYCFVETGSPAIITDHEMEFIGGVKLESRPEVMIISEGISLPEKMDEYKDAKTLMDIREGNFPGKLKFWKHDNIREKYHLDGAYSLDDAALNLIIEDESNETTEEQDVSGEGGDNETDDVEGEGLKGVEGLFDNNSAVDIYRYFILLQSTTSALILRIPADEDSSLMILNFPISFVFFT
ncbi:MAG: hypothetical protein WDZ69_02710 [Candidatus Pacearchaeota archaeon]